MGPVAAAWEEVILILSDDEVSGTLPEGDKHPLVLSSPIEDLYANSPGI